jgi:RNase P subunit RPR2
MPYKDPDRQREAQRRCYRAHPERQNEKSRRWRQANPAAARAIAERYNVSHPDYHREYKRRRKYGVPPEHQRAMLQAQNHCCAICGIEDWAAPGGVLHLDHNHVTGKVRAFLCKNCNTVLGHAKDDPERLRKAIAYLEAHR